MLGFLSLVAVVAMYLERHIASYYAMQTATEPNSASRHNNEHKHRTTHEEGFYRLARDNEECLSCQAISNTLTISLYYLWTDLHDIQISRTWSLPCSVFNSLVWNCYQLCANSCFRTHIPLCPHSGAQRYPSFSWAFPHLQPGKP